MIDNWFTSVPLVQHHLQMNIIGQLKKNKNLQLPVQATDIKF